jgi:hypothetical protein
MPLFIFVPTHAQCEANIIGLAFDSVEWNFAARGRYQLVKDPRGLYQIFHPWDISETGDFADLTTKVTIPDDWNPPIYLNLYANDTYVAEGWEEVRSRWMNSAPYHACHHLVGHRFKQVLIDEKVIWEQDVGDSEDFDYFHLDVSKCVSPGKSFRLTLRVVDKVGSSVRLPRDEFHPGIWSWQALNDPDAEKKFYTRVFWGDVALSAGRPLSWEENPSRREVQLNPIRLDAERPVEHASGVFLLDCPNGLPEEGYPVTWGVPFGEGRLFDENAVRLLDVEGDIIPLQTEVLHRWEDGSIHWLLLDFIAPSDTANKNITLEYGAGISSPPIHSRLKVAESEDAIHVDTGAIRFLIRRGSKRLVEQVTLSGETDVLVKELTGEVVARDSWISTRFYAVSEEIAVEAAGPIRATIRSTGHLVAGDAVFGRYTFRIHAFDGKPYVRIFFRIFNDTDAPAQLVEEFLIRLKTAIDDGEAVIGKESLRTNGSETGRLLVRQHRHDAYEIFEGNDLRRNRGERWRGPITLRNVKYAVSGAVRHFAELYPKRMWAGYGGQLVFDLFTRTIEYEQYVMTRGEAKREELLLDFRRVSTPMEKIQAPFHAFKSPPILISPEWYAEEQAFGRGAPLTRDRFPELYRWMVERTAPNLVCTVPLGLRNWPDSYSDSIYSAYRGTWGNMYQEMDYGAYILALLAGERRWFDYAEAYQRHFMDIDICHYHPDPGYIGASYGISPYHTGHKPYSLNAPLAGLFLLFYLTGDQDARDAAVGIANWLHAENVGVGSGSGRAVGWPLRSLAIAYENTYDEKYLEACRRLAEFALSRLMPRRGFFSEPPATWHYRGGVPGMNAILAAGLMRYWRVSGDERVGRACANIAYNMAYSWMSPMEPGLILGADPLQQVYLTGYAMQDVLPIFWGYELTGDKTFLEKGADVMRKSILADRHRGSAFGLSRYWEMQDILYYYGLYRQRTDADRRK